VDLYYGLTFLIELIYLYTKLNVMNVKLDLNEYAFLISAVHNSTVQGKNAHFVSNVLSKLEGNYTKLQEVPPPPPLQK